MTVQCTLVSQLERPILSNLLLDVKQKLLAVRGLMADRVRVRGSRRKKGDCTAASRRRVVPGQIGIAVNLWGRVRIRVGHAPGDVARHVEIPVADILVVER